MQHIPLLVVLAALVMVLATQHAHAQEPDPVVDIRDIRKVRGVIHIDITANVDQLRMVHFGDGIPGYSLPIKQGDHTIKLSITQWGVHTWIFHSGIENYRTSDDTVTIFYRHPYHTWVINKEPSIDTSNFTGHTVTVGEQFSFTLNATDEDGHNLRYSSRHGGVEISGSTLRWTPGSGDYRSGMPTNITVTTSDNFGGVTSADLQVTVRPVASFDPPSSLVAVRDQRATLDMEPYITTYPSNVSRQLALVGTSHQDKVEINGTSITYTPSPGATSDSFELRLAADDATVTRTINITLIDEFTVADQNYDLLDYNFTTTVAQDATAIIPVITDPDDDRTIRSASNPPLGSFFDSYQPLGNLLNAYLPFGIIAYDTRYSTGRDIITYTVDDGMGGTSNGTIRITIIEPNTNPVLKYIGDRSTNAQDTLTFQTRADDDEDDANTLTFGLEGAPAGAMMTPQGYFSWRPADSDIGRHIFTVTVTDPAGAADSEEIAVLVRPAGTANLHQPPLRYPVFERPVAPDIQAATRQGQPVAIIPPIDPSQTITYVSSPAKGSIRSETPRLGFIVYTPASGQSGVDTIIYTVSGSNSGIIRVYINEPGNTRPVLGTINSASAKVGGHLAFDASATDEDGHALTFGIANAPAGATINSATGRFSWEPAIWQAGNHTVTITVRDGHGGADWQDVNMAVSFTPPTARNIELRTDTGRSISMDIADILHDPDGDSATASIYIRPSMGHAEASGTTITYTANHDADGTDFFSYMITNNHGASGIWDAIVKVGPHAIDPTVNRDPVAPNLLVRTIQGTEFVYIRPAPTDPDGDVVNITSAVGTSRGTVLNNTLHTGLMTYRPQPEYYGIDTINYTVSDGRGGTDTGTITIYVREQTSSNPQLDYISGKAVNANNRLSFVVTGYGSPQLIFGIDDAPAGATISQHGVFGWMPTNSQLGYHNFTIVAHNSRGGAVWQDVGIRVHPAGTINSNPAAPDIAVPVAPGGLASIQPSVSDPDGNTVEISSATGSTRGTINNDQLSSGIILYAPSQTNGTDTIIYTVSDDNGGTSVGTITVIIGNSPVLDPIVSMNVTAYDTVQFQASAVDPNGDALNYTLSGHPRGAVITGTGEFSWTPDGAQTGAHTFTVIVSDGSNTDRQNVIVTVTANTTDVASPNPMEPDIQMNTRPVIAPISNTTVGSILEAYMSRGLVAFSGGPAPGLDAVRGGTSAGFLIAGILVNGTYAGLPGAAIADHDISDSDDIMVFINKIGNVPPVLSSVGGHTVNARDTLAFLVSATDFDGAVYYWLSDAPDNATISGLGYFSWTPESTDVGSHTFVVIAHDEHGATDTESVTITVLPAGARNEPPVAPNMTATVDPNDRITIIPAVYDPDGDRVWIAGAAGIVEGSIVTSDDRIEYRAASNVIPETITYTVRDGRGATTTGSISINTEERVPESATVSMPVGSGLSHDCTEDNQCFIPYEVTVAVGGEVTWVNDDRFIHVVHVGQYGGSGPVKFNSGVVNSGGEFTRTFDAPGTYDYVCYLHPWMTGTVIVAGE